MCRKVFRSFEMYFPLCLQNGERIHARANASDLIFYMYNVQEHENVSYMQKRLSI